MPLAEKVVVIAEDETVIRMVAVAVLAEAGWQVIEACHAEEALVALRARPHEIHVLFTDVNMPGEMDGLALAHHVRGYWPHIGLLIASGRLEATNARLPARSIFLPKPYDPAHVVRHAHSLVGLS